MSTILLAREQLQKLYTKYSFYIEKAMQFVWGLFVFGLINSNIGFMRAASSMLCTVGLSVVCAFLPMTIMVIAATALVTVHFFALSMPIAGVALIVFLLMYIFYFRFTPKKAWLVLLTPIAFALRVPYLIPVAFGLLGTPVYLVPAACGTIAYYMIHLVRSSASSFQGTDTAGMIENVMTFTRQLFTNKEMWLMVLAMSITILLVHAVRTRSIDFAWKIASAAGAVCMVVICTAGNVALDLHISYGAMIVGAVLAVVVGLVLEVLFFSVDYARTEHIQFEDDEYCYYVKAVPKMGVAAPKKRVKHINEHQETTAQETTGQETTVIDAEEVKKRAEAAKPSTLSRSAKRANGSRQKSNTAQKQQSSKMENPDDILMTRSLSQELGLDDQQNK